MMLRNSILHVLAPGVHTPAVPQAVDAKFVSDFDRRRNDDLAWGFGGPPRLQHGVSKMVIVTFIIIPEFLARAPASA